METRALSFQKLSGHKGSVGGKPSIRRSLIGELSPEPIRQSGKGARMKKLLLIFMTLVLAACTAVGSAMGNQSEIEQNKEKWENANISHYRYHLSITCFCIFSQEMPLIIEVQDGEVLSMEYQSGNEIDATSRELFEKYATIDRFFAELEAGLNGAADEVTAKYDETYGFPTEVTIDFVKEATDDELYLNLSNFEELP
jgi:hypothetical protein